MYGVAAEPAPGIVLYHEGFTVPALHEDGRAWTAMNQQGRLLLERFDGAGSRLSFECFSPDRPRSFTVEVDGKHFGSFEVGTMVQRIEITGLPEAESVSVAIRSSETPVDVLDPAFGKVPVPASLYVCGAGID